MSKVPGEKGDFGLPKRPISRNQIVGIYDLVGYTELSSNKELIEAVRTMETQLELTLEPEFWWDERTKGGVEKPTNTILLRSTGDGYIVAFSQGIDDLKALQSLTRIHSDIRRKHAVKLGINKGENYVSTDLNIRVNIIGWGINLAARALQFAEKNQIICTEHLAKTILKTYKPDVDEKIMIDLGTHTVKNTRVHLFNYYKKREFGAPTTKSKME